MIAAGRAEEEARMSGRTRDDVRRPGALRDRSAPAPLESDWMQGMCHVHAIAAVRAHGGHFVVITDNDDDEGARVLHVLSVHQAPTGPVVRDALGESPEGDLFEHVERSFPGRFGDRADASLDGITALVERGALMRYGPRDVADASLETTVTACPGSLLPAADGPGP
ncbi:MAG: hypothetical protein DI629_19980 [Mesorhizobium amorphae]|nr:MAG: hypothetical protein DI629_19980 [Mesorhizobium amorphae]